MAGFSSIDELDTFKAHEIYCDIRNVSKIVGSRLNGELRKYEVLIATLDLKLGDGRIDQATYDEQRGVAMKKYNAGLRKVEKKRRSMERRYGVVIGKPMAYNFHYAGLSYKQYREEVLDG